MIRDPSLLWGGDRSSTELVSSTEPRPARFVHHGFDVEPAPCTSKRKARHSARAVADTAPGSGRPTLARNARPALGRAPHIAADQTRYRNPRMRMPDRLQYD